MVKTIQRSDADRTFSLAVCERLGIDPAAVIDSGFNVTLTSTDEYGRVELTAIVPKDELLEMAIAAGVKVAPA